MAAGLPAATALATFNLASIFKNVLFFKELLPGACSKSSPASE
jgi:hypothetical protein